jgi:hypothetical protein
MMRVYIPATLATVGDLLACGVTADPVSAYAVTIALRAWVEQDGPAGEEELELVALSEAARACLRMLAQTPGLPARRVVLAVDVPDGHVRVEDGSDLCGPGQVTVTEAVPVDWLRALHVDEPGAETDVRSAAGAVAGADAGDAVAESVVAGAESRELLWYAPQELALVATPSA